MEGQRTQCPCLVCAYDLDGVSIYRQRKWEKRRGEGEGNSKVGGERDYIYLLAGEQVWAD